MWLSQHYRAYPRHRPERTICSTEVFNYNVGQFIFFITCDFIVTSQKTLPKKVTSRKIYTEALSPRWSGHAVEGVELTLWGCGFKKSPGSLGAHVALLETLFAAFGGRAFRGICPHCGSQSCACTLMYSFTVQSTNTNFVRVKGRALQEDRHPHEANRREDREGCGWRSWG